MESGGGSCGPCADDDDCGGTGSGFVCATPIAGTPGSGNTCRAEWLGSYNGIRVYADTSVYGGVFDEEFAEASRTFFEQVRGGRFRLILSE